MVATRRKIMICTTFYLLLAATVIQLDVYGADPNYRNYDYGEPSYGLNYGEPSYGSNYGKGSNYGEPSYGSNYGKGSNYGESSYGSNYGKGSNYGEPSYGMNYGEPSYGSNYGNKLNYEPSYGSNYGKGVVYDKKQYGSDYAGSDYGKGLSYITPSYAEGSNYGEPSYGSNRNINNVKSSYGSGYNAPSYRSDYEKESYYGEPSYRSDYGKSLNYEGPSYRSDYGKNSNYEEPSYNPNYGKGSNYGEPSYGSDYQKGINYNEPDYGSAYNPTTNYNNPSYELNIGKRAYGSCPACPKPLHPAVLYCKGKFAIKGKVLNENGPVYKIKVLTVYKGNLKPKSIIKVKTDCNSYFKSKTAHLITGNSMDSQGVIQLDACDFHVSLKESSCIQRRGMISSYQAACDCLDVMTVYDRSTEKCFFRYAIGGRNSKGKCITVKYMLFKKCQEGLID